MNNKVKITFVNHASYIVSYKDIHLLVDPWITGTIFNNGWSSISRGYFPNKLINKITHIWYSHEHPDHFSPIDLKKIKDESDKIPKIIFQKTKDKRLKKYCEKIGFEIIELDSWEKFKLSHSFSLTIISHGRIDSISIVEVEDYKIVNTNDCVLSDKNSKEIFKKYGDIDILFTQFSYAWWMGKPKEKYKRVRAANEILEGLLLEIKNLMPKFTVPFASFIYYCHEENQYMNDGRTNFQQIIDKIACTISKPIIFYPGDEWEVGKENFNNDLNISKYLSEFNNSKKNNLIKSNKIPIEILLNCAEKYFLRIKKKNGKFLMITFCLFAKIMNFFSKSKRFAGYSGIKIYLIDYDKCFNFNWIKGFFEVSNYKNIDIKISSESLDYIFRYEWGVDTLLVNGRAYMMDDNTPSKIRKAFSLGLLNSNGINLLSAILSKLTNKNIYNKIENIDASHIKL